jgi:general stress protein 26
VSSAQHIKRVRQELKNAGVTSYGMLKSESIYLPKIIHPDEHIGGVIYGRTKQGSVMLIATDHRIIYLDTKPFFTTIDELTYDVVSGVRHNTSGLFSSVTLHTRITDYDLRFVNERCAQIFIKYVEHRRLEQAPSSTAPTATTPAANATVAPYAADTLHAAQPADNATTSTAAMPVFQNINNADALAYIKSQDLAVVSTVSREGTVSGAVMYYLVDQDAHLYIMTKSETNKARGILSHGQLALTIHQQGSLKTAQISGIAQLETNQKVKDQVFSYFTKPRTYQEGKHAPPVTKLKKGAFMIVKITPTSITYTDYSKQP